MHELAITEGILETAIPEAEKAGAKKILSIRLKIGQYSGIIDECVQYYFGEIAKGTIAEGAVIKTETIPNSWDCFVENIEVE